MKNQKGRASIISIIVTIILLITISDLTILMGLKRQSQKCLKLHLQETVK